MKIMATILMFLSFAIIFLACSQTNAVSGQVIDYDTGQPVSDALVTLCFSSEAPCRSAAADDISITDEKGYYSLQISDELASGTYNSIAISKEGYITFSDNLERMKDYDLSVYLKRK